MSTTVSTYHNFWRERWAQLDLNLPADHHVIHLSTRPNRLTCVRGTERRVTFHTKDELPADSLTQLVGLARWSTPGRRLAVHRDDCPPADNLTANLFGQVVYPWKKTCCTQGRWPTCRQPYSQSVWQGGLPLEENLLYTGTVAHLQTALQLVGLARWSIPGGKLAVHRDGGPPPDSPTVSWSGKVVYPCKKTSCTQGRWLPVEGRARPGGRGRGREAGTCCAGWWSSWLGQWKGVWSIDHWRCGLPGHCPGSRIHACDRMGGQHDWQSLKYK